ncbi:DMT family transporter [Actinocatenispora sera]|uniref:Membrane protein n=1 Tax=Actinocatenispora sera TaxID=390989 RepID=A0A810L3R9_9ACTN|nr:DMT family transporter [Actinocatenispora sera]BCJ30023.1 membrane protein [Actinocatenispora sera]
MSEGTGRQRLRTAAPVLAAGVTVLLWASAFVAIRHVGSQLSAGPLALGRLLVGSLVLGVLVAGQALRRRAAARRAVLAPGAASGGTGTAGGPARATGWPRGRAWLGVVVCGLAWFGMYNVALNAAERRVDAGTAAMLVNVGPILLAVLAGVFLREGFPRMLVIGVLVAFAGALVMGVATARPGTGDLPGVLLCLLAAVGYAIGVLSQKPVLATTSALRTTWLAATVGALACLPYAPRLVHELSAAPAGAVLWTVYLGALPTALAFTTWAYALARTGAARMGATTYLVPPAAVLLGWLLLAEAPAALALVGGAICLVGVAITRRAPHRSPAPSADRTPVPAGD